MKGFVNINNTCYFNTSLQCLLQIPILSNHYLKNEYKGPCEFTNMYSQLVHSYWTNDDTKIINVSEIFNLFRKSFPRFKADEENDIQECVLCIIDIIERADPVIKDWFYGKRVQQVLWPGGESRTEETFSIYILTSRGSDLKSMLCDSLKWNVIENFVDNQGMTHHLATSRFLLSKLPKILMISFDKKSLIHISEQIVIDKFEYDLIASGVHVGHQNSGHYVSFTKHRNVWYYKNDEFISPSELPTHAGHYLLIYNLRTP